MKRISLMVGIAALAAMNAMAQLRSSFGRRAQDDIPNEVAEKIPEDCRDYVAAEIRDRASKQATAEAEEKFNVLFMPGAWTNGCGKSVLLRVGDRSSYALYDKDGCLKQTQNGGWNDFEECRWRDIRQKEIIGELWKNQPVVDAALSNAVAKVAKEKEIPRSGLKQMLRTIEEGRPRVRRNRSKDLVQMELLEELIPLEEAMELARNGNGKGYFQLALRYAGGNELPQNPNIAYKMLCKARDVDYANALLVEGLCDEAGLKTPNGSIMDLAFVGSSMREYCGVWFTNARRGSDSLTNEVAFARVMGKYEKAKALGALTATNQIAALNERLADFNAERPKREAALAKEREKRERREANNKVALELLGDVYDGGNVTKELPYGKPAGSTLIVKKMESADGKIDEFLKEYFGVKFGDEIGRFTQLPENVRRDRSERYCMLPVLKKFKYLDKAIGMFKNGKLISVSFVADIARKYSQASVEERMEQIYEALVKMWGVEKGAFAKNWLWPHKVENARYELGRWRSHSLFDGIGIPNGCERYGIEIKDSELEESLEKAESEKGEVLPELK